MEKLVLALLIASKKLQPYFQDTTRVLTNYPLRKIMQKLEVLDKLIQWTLELSQHDIKYDPRMAIKR